MANTELGLRAAVVQIKGDWMEFAASLGLPSWADKHHPCPFCMQPKAGLYIASPFDPLTTPWVNAQHAEYDQACVQCEHHVVLTKEHHNELLTLLEYDKRPKGARGRALIRPYPPLGLVAGDRLSIGADLSEIGEEFDTAFIDGTRTEFHVIFWRRRDETRARWRNLLFDATIGITVDILAIDILHAFYLGVARDFCMHAMWLLISSRVFGPFDGVAARDELSVLSLRHDLWAWYAAEAQAHPGKHIHRLENLSLGMLGSATKPKLNTKAAETKTLVGFCLAELKKFRDTIPRGPGSCLIGIGEAMTEMIDLFDSCPRVLAPANVQRLYDLIKRIFNCWAGAQLGMVPKMHMMLHLVERCRTHGNPAYYSTFLDESLNRTLRDIARAAHATTWAARIFERFSVTEQVRAKRSRGQK